MKKGQCCVNQIEPCIGDIEYLQEYVHVHVVAAEKGYCRMWDIRQQMSQNITRSRVYLL